MTDEDGADRRSGSHPEESGAEATSALFHPAGDEDAEGNPDAVIDGVLIQVALAGEPEVGIPVLFHDGNGQLIGRTETDPAGEALADVPDGSSVTVLRNAGLLWRRHFTTVREVERGDTIRFGTFSPRLPLLGTATITLPAGPAGSSYEVSSSCGNSSSHTNELDIRLFGECESPVPLMAKLRTGFWEPVTGYILVPAVRIEPDAHINVSKPWRDPIEHTVHVTDVPEEVIGAYAPITSYLRGHFLHSMGTPVWLGVDLGSPSDGELTHTFVEASVGDEVIAGVTLVGGEPLFFQHNEVRAIDGQIDGDPLVELDASAEIIPWVYARQEWDGNLSPYVEWRTDGEQEYSGTYIELEMYDNDETLLGSWEMVMPPGLPGGGPGDYPNLTSVPELPADLADEWPSVASYYAGFQLNLLRVSDESYAEFRQHAASEQLIARKAYDRRSFLQNFYFERF